MSFRNEIDGRAQHLLEMRLGTIQVSGQGPVCLRLCVCLREDMRDVKVRLPGAR